MSTRTACPLDCYDACEMNIIEEKIAASKNTYTSGFLCPHLNHFHKYPIIEKPTYMGKSISMAEALIILKKMLLNSPQEKILHYKGNGNFGLMQYVTEHFFASYGATLTDGNLCDGVGEFGILQGRGSNKNMPLSEIEKSEVIILWGRNPHATSSHLLPLLKGKILIVIDPLKIKSAKTATHYIQIKPHADTLLALVICHFLYAKNMHNNAYIQEHTNNFEEFYALIQTINIPSALEELDITLDVIISIVEIIQNKKVAIICGLGVQKYNDGANAMRAIDAIAVSLGLFGKEGSGVAYLGNSKESIESPFNTKAKKVSKVNTDFSLFKTVFIQGANPLGQMPNTQRVEASIKNVENIIYFGLYHNETSKIAHLIIPAKAFLFKNDIRTSYSSNVILRMHKSQDSLNGISEYDLSTYLCNAFSIAIKDEEYYINHYMNFSQKNDTQTLKVKHRQDIPYKNGFDTQDRTFVFLKKYPDMFHVKKGLFLLTSKSAKSLNSQFHREQSVYLHSSHGFDEGIVICIRSRIGSVVLAVKHNDGLREDCVLIYSGTKGVNNLTTSQHSMDGKFAIYQEEKVEIQRV
ncbi:molybdopterin-dependent oxidoreductase [Sulfurimonas sp. SAG-AH-194-I05]|nr:molybdopterin-dependent oxidoreductase [Sulfurimonas sp. SAG-AH-194-I05]MDF1874538.1 molybdopterin-dependent oxidoreductase [Sulfurimonas sp. SAG-AH-194-I05]